MNDSGQAAAWLERAEGEPIRLLGSCSLGRSRTNHIVLEDKKVSRRHAIIHPQGQSEFWLVDLGSINGTYVNERRVAQPVQLQHQDRIQIGQFQLQFIQPRSSPTPIGEHSVSEQTIVEIRSRPCWLLVADLESSTVLLRQLPADELPMVVGGWFLASKEIIETSGGAINKYLGDGYLAYWGARENAAEQVAKAVHELKALQGKAAAPFRLVVHFGQVMIGGMASMGEESLSGQEVNFAFRMEKLAGSLGISCLLSDAARQQLEQLLPAEPAGAHSLQGFEGSFSFYKG
jgi:adenylate cyclase